MKALLLDGPILSLPQYMCKQTKRMKVISFLNCILYLGYVVTYSIQVLLLECLLEILTTAATVTSC